jgi:hypothetical protein
LNKTSSSPLGEVAELPGRKTDDLMTRSVRSLKHEPMARDRAFLVYPLRAGTLTHHHGAGQARLAGRRWWPTWPSSRHRQRPGGRLHPDRAHGARPRRRRRAGHRQVVASPEPRAEASWTSG